MKVKVTSLLGNQSKVVKNLMDLSSQQDVTDLLRAVITDRTTTLTREDGKEIAIVFNGTVHTEVYNQKELLLAWANMVVDEFPLGGAYAASSI